MYFLFLAKHAENAKKKRIIFVYNKAFLCEKYVFRAENLILFPTGLLWGLLAKLRQDNILNAILR